MKKIFKKICLVIMSISIFALFTGCKSKIITINGLKSVLVGDTIQLSAVISDTDENPVFIWESENPSIATVDDTGLVTGISQGETYVYATYQQYTGKIKITVVKKEILARNILKDPEIITEDLVVGEKIEIALYETTEGTIESEFNPYDYDQINVYGKFVSPSGKEIIMPAFWYKDYEIKINEKYTQISNVSGVASKDPNEIQGMETVVWTDEIYHYRLRVSLDEVGEYNYYINVEEEGVIIQSLQSKLEVKENSAPNNKGIIQVDKDSNRNFVDGNGSTFVPVGVNLCWWTNNTRKTYDYNVWFDQMNQNNINMARLWMATWGFSIHWGNSYNNFNSRLNMAARLDKVMNLADENDIYIQLCFVNHGQFSSSVNPLWDSNPYNVNNGGIISSPSQFFTNEECIRTFKNEVKYLVARYGYSDKIMAWELFNEVDWTDYAETSNKVAIYNWHKEIGSYLDSIDPYNHMITTSYKTNTGMSYLLDVIDYTCPHDYGYEKKNVNTNLPKVMCEIANKYKKPTIQSEIGINWESGTATAKIDPNGISIRQALWSGMLGEGAGAGMQWWWDSWIHPNKLWSVYNGAGIYAKEMDLTGGLYTSLYNNSDVVISDNSVKLIGYKYDDRIYGYIYDNNWWYMNTNVSEKDVTVEIPMNDGMYTLTIYNTVTGEILSTKNDLVIENGTFICDFKFIEDSAFIIKKN